MSVADKQKTYGPLQRYLSRHILIVFPIQVYRIMKLYVAIQRFLNKNWVHYIVLFFILISILAVIASSFEEMSRYRLALFGITYISSFVFLLEYAARILSAPALHPTKSAIKARLLYTFSFYGFVDFVAILPCVLTYICWNTEVVHSPPKFCISSRVATSL